MPEQLIELRQHDPNWVKDYLDESENITEVISHYFANIHHVGSTSIPGIKAKPIIDILVESERHPPSNAIISCLDSLSYKCHAESGVQGRWFFTKGTPRRFNLHWCPTDGQVARSQILFRDRLRNSAELAHEYESIKISAAPGQTIDSQQYAAAKATFIAKVLA